jgi:putative membrane protein
MTSALGRIVANAVALAVAVWLTAGLRYEGSAGRFLLVALLFGIVNALLRPLLTILTCPLIVLTLGLFTLVINAVLLLVTGWLSERWGLGFTVDGFWPAFVGGVIVTLISTLVALVMRDGEDRPA